MKIIVLAGMPGAGKEEFVEVARTLGYEVVRMGDVVREWAAKQGIGSDDRSVGGYADAERKIHGYDIWARRSAEKVRAERTIIDGSRGTDELRVFKNAFGGDVKLLAIQSSQKARYERLQRRGRKDAPKTWEEFLVREERELSWGLGNLIATADETLVNEGALDDFKREVKAYLTKGS
ncbi:MAG: flagellar hook-basal body complex protein FliE [Methanomassiliicoccales archaeon]|nr:flagellar hook-basal body complex protein FliE [Methanomassiliicoccales archaeon]